MRFKTYIDSKQKMVISLEETCFLGYLTNRGNNIRHLNNEDALIINYHPLDENLKMLAVCDGVSNCEYGKEASEYITKSLARWFNSLPTSYINTSPTLKSVFWGEMQKINRYLVNRYEGEASATLACAMIGERDTVIASSGDSRGYIIADDKLKQVTIDHLVWFNYNDPQSIQKDDLRFMVGNSYISRSIGSSLKDYRPDAITVANDEYESLFLFTDGVTDVLSDKKIKEIYDKCSDKETMKEIIKEAVFSAPEYIDEEIKERFKDRMYMINNQTYPGHDNASVILYKKRRD